jgi:L-ascorbate metabolism protein UlaG (beta-lactamase superfamily)
MRKLLHYLKKIVGILASLLGMLVLIGVVFINTSPEFGAAPNEEKVASFSSTENYKEGVFVNASQTDVDGKIDFGRLLSEWFKEGNKVPTWSLPVQKITPETIARTSDSITKATWFGHSAILLEMDGKKLFLDPMLGSVPAPHPWLAGHRFNDTLPLALEDIPFMDAVLISHDHYDHLDYTSISQMKNNVGHFFVPLGVGSHLEAWGIPISQITELDWWQSINFQGLQLTATPSRHFSGRGITDRFKTQWASWVIKGRSESIYFSGDSGYDDHFKEIGEKFGPFDLAIMECGQYDPQWPLIHMMPEETVKGALDLKAMITLPIHWGSFNLSLHSWEDPIERVTKAAKTKGVQLATPVIGEQIVIGQKIPQSEWWKQ